MSDNAIDRDSSAEIDRWCEWIKGDINHQVNGIKLKCIAFASWHDIVVIASPKNSLFFEWVAENHIKALAVAVRSMCENNRKTRSLRVLMGEIKNKVKVLTREWWISRVSISSLYCEQAYERYVSRFDLISGEGDYLDPKIVHSDIKT